MRSIFLLALFFPFIAVAQQASVSGVVLNEDGNPVPGVSITISGKRSGTQSDSEGKFSLQVQPGKRIELVFSHTAYKELVKPVYLNAGENEHFTIRLIVAGKMLQNITIEDEKERKEAGLIRIDPANAGVLPSASGGVEAIIKTLVGSNNELTSQYNVRGGNYDENLVYINDFEIYRPYLVSSGQQEGLSLINPALARNVNFYMGGFQAKYGDKMSSVLDIEYRRPFRTAGNVYLSLLEQGAHVEGIFKNTTYQVAARNKTNANVLRNQPVTGIYRPSASDVQANITHRFSNKWRAGLLTIITGSAFNFFPESVKKTSSVFSPFYTANLGLDIYFEGREKDRYSTALIGTTIDFIPSEKYSFKLLLSRFRNNEEENYDIGGAYLFGDRDFDNSSNTFGQIINPLGAGYSQSYARNKLEITAYNVALKGTAKFNKHLLQWGTGVERTDISDRLYEFEYRDSAGYSLPYSPGQLTVTAFRSSTFNRDILRYSGFIQDNLLVALSGGDLSIQAGIRYNYNDLNNEFLISPRAQFSYMPEGKNTVYKFSAGVYDQPPFYRELRNMDGSVNTAIRSQKSFQLSAGFDHSFRVTSRPFRITGEAYYKKLRDVIPYDIDNVKIRYHGNNNAKAYAAGVEFRLFGELVKDAESWLSIGLMRTREDLGNDHYYNYLNAAGEVITAGTPDKQVTDSLRNDIGWLRRPSDRLLTIGLFLQDYLSTNKNFKIHLNGLYGSNMPYNIPGNPKYRNALLIEPYIRLDIGLSAQVLGPGTKRRSLSPFRNLRSVWVSAEVLNVIDRPNTISFQLINDFSGNTFAIPNRLTPRLYNLKLQASF